MIKLPRKKHPNFLANSKWRKHLKYVSKGIVLGIYLMILTSCIATRYNKPLQTKSLTTTESNQIDTQLQKLYKSFCYDDGEEPNWELMRSVFIEGAQFVGEAPAGEASRPQTVEEFIASWQKAIRERSAPTVETAEQIIDTKATKVGKLIRVEVLFRAMKKNDPSPRKPGLDSLVFANVNGG